MACLTVNTYFDYAQAKAYVTQATWLDFDVHWHFCLWIWREPLDTLDNNALQSGILRG
jgi:hypothetical protein